MRSPSDARPAPGAAGYWGTLVKPALSRDAHRPHYRNMMRAAALELAARGLTARDVAQALSITEAAARQLLSQVQP